jgi:hypothetical protein
MVECQLRNKLLCAIGERLALFWRVYPVQPDLLPFAVVHDCDRVAIGDAHDPPREILSER